MTVDPVPFEQQAREEAERRMENGEGLHYGMEVNAFVLGAIWGAEVSR